jgi:hypothetical protein
VKFIKLLQKTQSVCTREKEREKERKNRKEIKFFFEKMNSRQKKIQKLKKNPC